MLLMEKAVSNCAFGTEKQIEMRQSSAELAVNSAFLTPSKFCEMIGEKQFFEIHDSAPFVKRHIS